MFLLFTALDPLLVKLALSLCWHVAIMLSSGWMFILATRVACHLDSLSLFIVRKENILLNKTDNVWDAGKVYVNGKVINKAGTPVPEKAIVEITAEVPKYVCRWSHQALFAWFAWNNISTATLLKLYFLAFHIIAELDISWKLLLNSLMLMLLVK